MKAVADLERRPFQIGTPGDERNRSRADYISRERIEQARRLVHRMKNQGVELLLPIDFVLDNGKVSRTIPAEDAARDVGPATGEFFAAKLDEFLEHHRAQEAAGKGPTVAFHNGVFGMFEREEFTHGTRAFLGQLRRLHEAGVRVYVGGGEGGTALLRFGGPSWVTHCFTAGTTLLKALGAEPIPCVKALYLASIRSPR